MNNSLLLKEFTIKDLFDFIDDNDRKYKQAYIEGSLCADINLTSYDLFLLTKIIGCTEEELINKRIIGVLDGNLVKAIGYQGLYIPLCYQTSWIMTESQMCDLYGKYNIIRENSDGEKIVSYIVTSKQAQEEKRVNGIGLF